MILLGIQRRYFFVLLLIIGIAVTAHLITLRAKCSSISTATLPRSTEFVRPNDAIRAQVIKRFNKSPLSFEANQGQANSEVKFVSRGNGYELFLTANETILALRSDKGNGAVLRMQLIDASPNLQPIGVDKLSGTSNYIISSNSQNWRTNNPTYAKVYYSNVYPNVDMVYYGKQGQLEYDFMVFPGANPNAITLSFQGANKVEIDGQGNLVLHTSSGKIIQRKPHLYQEMDGLKQTINGRYLLKGKNRVGFQVGAYNTSKLLVIDPVLTYSRFYGGGFDDASTSIAVDASGNAYITGVTGSLALATKNAPQPIHGGGSTDTFITKLDSTGAVVYSTYLGGSNIDGGTSIAVDSAGNVYVVGFTTSPDFPLVNALQQNYGGRRDAFIAKLNADGSSLAYSTYFGGNGLDEANGLAIDSLGTVYVTGSTRSINFPIKNALQVTNKGGDDAFIAKLNSTGSNLIYATYLGGSNSDIAGSIAIDANGNAYIAGFTRSLDLLTANPLQPNYGGGDFDAFVAKVNPEGSTLIYSTYLGGTTEDAAGPIAVDSDGNAYITGNTNSVNFPLVNPLQGVSGGGFDAFVAKLNTAGSSLLYSSFLGGSSNEISSGITLDSAGNIYVIGSTASTNFPLANSLQSINGGDSDAFITKLDTVSNRLIYSTYLGGNKRDNGLGIAVDNEGAAYLTGGTISQSFLTKNISQTTNNIGSLDVIVGEDAFITKITDPIAEVDFSLSFNPTTIAVRRGESVKATVNINRTGNFAGNIKVLPPSTKSTNKLKLKITPRTGSTTGASVAFTIKAKQKAPVGTQQLVFTGQDESGRVRSNTVTVVIQ
ncbi:MAG: SBBP repeat-containing protein [Acidobacteriota bacterium]